jgi:peptidoglycan hydrolase-like protein with peptidoglycan-binding domain
LPAASHASASPTPTATPTAVATASVSPSGSAGTSTTPLVLSEGDSGPEVVEMQARLKQTWAYTGAADGDFDADTRDGVARYQLWNNIQGDPKGVYGANTRRVLEAATKKP